MTLCTPVQTQDDNVIANGLSHVPFSMRLQNILKAISQDRKLSHLLLYARHVLCTAMILSLPARALGYGIGINFNSTTSKNDIYKVNFNSATSSFLSDVAFSSGFWNPSSFSIDPAARLFYIITADNTLYTFDLTTGAVLQTSKVSLFFQAAVLGKDGKLIGISSVGSGSAFYEINPTDGTTPLSPLNTVTLGGGGWVRETFLSDVAAGKFYILSADNTLYTFDLATGSVSAAQKLNGDLKGPIQAVIAGKDGQLIGIGLIVISPGVISRESAFYSIDPSTGTASLLNTVVLSGGGWLSDTFSSDPAGNAFYIVSADNTLYTFSLTDASVNLTAPLDIRPQLLIAVLPPCIDTTW